MLLGIDVGGTFTDAVIVSEGKVLAATKTATTHSDLLKVYFAQSILFCGMRREQLKELRFLPLS